MRNNQQNEHRKRRLQVYHTIAEGALALTGFAAGTVYDRAGYNVLVDYGEQPTPPFTPEQAEWADALLKRRGVR